MMVKEQILKELELLPESKLSDVLAYLRSLNNYQNTKQERKEVAANCPTNKEEFSIQEEIELLTSDLL